MSTAVIIETRPCVAPKNAKRNRRLRKKMHVDEFALKTLDYFFCHPAITPTDDVEDSLDLLCYVSEDVGLTLGWASTGGTPPEDPEETHAIFEVPHGMDHERLHEQITAAIDARYGDATIKSVIFDDAYWPF